MCPMEVMMLHEFDDLADRINVAVNQGHEVSIAFLNNNDTPRIEVVCLQAHLFEVIWDATNLGVLGEFLTSVARHGLEFTHNDALSLNGAFKFSDKKAAMDSRPKPRVDMGTRGDNPPETQHEGVVRLYDEDEANTGEYTALVDRSKGTDALGQVVPGDPSRQNPTKVTHIW